MLILMSVFVPQTGTLDKPSKSKSIHTGKDFMFIQSVMGFCTSPIANRAIQPIITS